MEQTNRKLDRSISEHPSIVARPSPLQMIITYISLLNVGLRRIYFRNWSLIAQRYRPAGELCTEERVDNPFSSNVIGNSDLKIDSAAYETVIFG